jgi:valyl-tRNA synthetase
MLDKNYHPAGVESRIYEIWERSGAFACGRKDLVEKGAKPYAIVIPPPNVTGSLHMGHALNNTLQDALVRFERMRGKDVLWQPGTDHAGIATQALVERQLAERQEPDRRAMGRDAFIKKVWEWKAESGGTIVNQLKRLGCSCDWSRERFTMDEGLSRAVLKVFVELHKAGLIYKDKRLVNWDPALLTAISDLEVVPTETDGHLWYFKYPIKQSGDGETRYMTVATTRPETMLGDTAIAVHPDDERWKEYVGKTVILPLVGREIPIVADEYADPEQGSGAVKITPAHDFNDFEVGRRHALELINILTPDGKLNDAVPEIYRGLDCFEARKRVVADLDALGLVEKIEPHKHNVPYGDRSNVVIEPYLTDQWYVNAKKLAESAIEAVERERTVFVPRNWEKTYYEWMRNIQPWCISRQLWWGHQIPAWYGPDGYIFVAYDEDEAQKQADAHYGETGVEIVRDPDVLDTWFSSALWPFSTLGWPDQTPELKRYYATDVLVTGFDIIFFWVARMMMMGLYFMKEVPFRTVYIHALVRDEKGDKMSKSKGNVMDPLDIIDGCDLATLVYKRTRGLLRPQDANLVERQTRERYPKGIKSYGADALRFTMAAMAAQGRDVKLSLERVEGYRNFGTKVWSAARFCQMNGCKLQPGFDPRSVKLPVNRWLAGETERAVRAVVEGLEVYKFNEAAGAAYRFVWGQFCDWYVELIKPILTGSDEAAKAECQAMASWTLDQILKLLHPFMPFLTEELWARIVEDEPELKRETPLILAPWPELDGLQDRQADEEIGWVIRLISETRSVRSEMNVPAGAVAPLVIVGANDATKAIANANADLIRRLARADDIRFAAEPPKGVVQFVLGEATIAIPLAALLDIAAEGERLKKEIAKKGVEIDKIAQRLGDEKFVSRAPEEVIEENRERKAEFEEAQAKLQAALGRLEAAA